MNVRPSKEESLDSTIVASSETVDEDTRLIELIRNGDRIAFDRLVLKYQTAIINLCIRMLGNVSDGEDAAQDTFMKMYKSIAQFKGKSRFATWLYSIALNTCKNRSYSWWSKIWKKAYKLDKPNGDLNGEEYNRELKDTRMLPSKELEQKMRASVIEMAVKKLPLIHRELIVLRDFQELSYEEIEDITHVSLGTIKSRLARARTALRQELKEVFDEH